MRPGPRIFASNAVWAGGPDVGAATKTPMTAGELADGRYRDVVPAPRPDNYELWALGTRLHGAASQRVLNVFMRFDLNTVGANGGVCDVCWDPLTLTATMVESRPAAAAPGEFISVGAIQPWGAGAGFAAWPGGDQAGAVRIAVDPITSNRAVVTDSVPNQSAWASTAYANFLQWPGGCLASRWITVAHTVIGDRFLFGDTAGLIYRAQNPAALATAAATPPVWAPAGPIILGASNHAAADVYPDDPGNDVLVALSLTQVSTSNATGNVWSGVVAHGLGSMPLDIAYSKAGSKWICILANGQIGTSLDNGATWAATASLPGAMAAATTSRIACDGFGDWVICLTDNVGNTTQLFASWDDGVTWVQVFYPIWVTNVEGIALCYGGGQFINIATDLAAACYVYTTLRAEE